MQYSFFVWCVQNSGPLENPVSFGVGERLIKALLTLHLAEEK